MCSGYLPVGEMVDLSLAYSTVYNLGLDKGGITAAVNVASTLVTRQGMVSILAFIQAIM